jgi:DeoR/GlpR family transcriptional regulator of sugar metabolism
MLAAERRRAILASLESGGAVRVADLAAELAVSEMTVRRDLDALDAQELLRKVHGGAVTRHHRGEEPRSSEKARQRRAEKVAIGRAAASLVDDGMTIAVGAGTTTTELARALRTSNRKTTVITNSLSVFEVLTDADVDGSPAVYLSGGSRTPSDALVGPIADTALASFRVDATFLGVHGFDAHAGLTSPNVAEAQTNRTLIEISDRLIVLADHTKHGEVGTNVFARLDQVRTLIVDDGLSVHDRTMLEGRVGELMVVTA